MTGNVDKLFVFLKVIVDNVKNTNKQSRIIANLGPEKFL
jgi:hypothetical protein